MIRLSGSIDVQSKSILEPLFKIESVKDCTPHQSLNETEIDSNTGKSLKFQDQLSSQSECESDQDLDLETSQDSGSESEHSLGDSHSSISDKESLKDDNEQDNPWLQDSSKPLLKSIKNHSQSFERVSSHQKALSKLIQGRKKITESIDEIDDSVIKIKQAEYIQSESDSETEIKLVSKKDLNGLSQMDVMQMAFADDQVIRDFEEEKNIVVDDEKPSNVDLTLPGWGSWGGNGLKPKKNVVVQRVVADKIDARKRRDANLKHVIINEKRQKKVIHG